MLAHNVRTLFPEFVEEDRTKNKYLSVDYAGMSVLAIRATQELNEIVKQQGMLIKELEGKLNG